MMPIKLTSENPTGTESNWGRTAADGYDAREAKSGALLDIIWLVRAWSTYKDTYTTSVAMLLMHETMEITMVHPSSEPSSLAGWLIIGPTPPAREIVQAKNAMPAVGANIAFAVNKCRLTKIRIGTQCIKGIRLTLCGSGTKWLGERSTKTRRST